MPFTVKQAATHVGVSCGLIYAWCADGTLPHMRVGRKGKRGRIRIATEDLDRLLGMLKVGKTEPEPTSTPVPARSAFRHLHLS